ncbi:MAG TPA: hypothetical protein VGB69_02565 [Edaphobacter sp.]
MKSTLKTMVGKLMTAGFLAGALMLAAPKANAQVVVGVQIGRPVVPRPVVVAPYAAGYYGPAYGRHGYYDRVRWEQERRAAWIRHQEWMRARRMGPDPYRYYYGR